MGRPSKLNPKVQARIIQALLACNTLEAAAAYGGIHYATMREWILKGEKCKSGKYHEFAEAIKKAQDEAEAMLIAEIRAHGRKTWQALAWLAERRHPERWAKPNRYEVSGPDGGPIKVEDARTHLKSALASIAARIRADEGD